MQIRPFFGKILFGLTLIIAARAEASVIYTYPSGYAVYIYQIGSTPYTFSFGINQGANAANPNPPETWDIPLLTIDNFSNESAWGQTFTLNAANTPTFNQFVSQITNGTPDTLGQSLFANGSGGSASSSEADFFFNDPTGALGIDLIGQTITDIEFAFADDPALGELFTWDVYGKYTITFLDNSVKTVPDTNSTLLLLGAACIPAFLVNRKRGRAHGRTVE